MLYRSLKSDNHPFEGQDIDASGLGWAMSAVSSRAFRFFLNPYDCIELKYDGALLDAASMAAGVTSPNFSSPLPWQQQLLTQLNLHGSTKSQGGEELVERRLLAALRVLLANDVEMVQRHDLNTLQSLAANAPLGTEIEASAFPSIELAIQFRIQKKSVIIDVMQELSRRLKSLLSKNTSAAQS
ncbi:hypothetical protein K2173_012671 [Erythroxylum novogranatense]|uniref:Rubisco LSMT substrate-binding domain-containing protein n=1 Tax=Erythroxylum novogranatense TaxID=1862640 RepID=A0AAV8S6P6_9ROSI|nr:hypothetical protein K2173_012671 [Erythroxylum novogranatense]